MKQVFARMTLFASLLMATVFLFSSCSKDDEAGISLTYSLSGSASASQAGNSNSSGSGTFSGTYNATTKVMTYTTSWTNLSGAPTSGGLFIGAVGQAGSSLYVWSMGSGLSTSGTFSASTTLNAEQEAQLLAGNAYYALGTAAFVSGEIRGQISASAQD